MNIISHIIGLIGLGAFIAGMIADSMWIAVVAIVLVIIHLALDHHIESREHWRRYFEDRS